MSSSGNDLKKLYIPDDALGIRPRDLTEAYITNARYQNEGLIWNKPKGILFGLFPGYKPEQDAHAFPDGMCTYFVVKMVMQSGWRLKLEGKFPHSRYMSFTLAKTDAGSGENGGGEFLRCNQIVPDQGSFNPFLPGVNREIASRKYTIYVVQSNPPADPAMRQPNTLYVSDDLVGKLLHFPMRMYLVDEGYDGSGVVPLNGSGNGLPVATLTRADGSKVMGPELPDVLQVQRIGEVYFPLNPWKNSIAAASDPETAPAKNPPRFELFRNTAYNVLGGFIDDDLTRVTRFPASTAGGFANNPDTQYLSTIFCFKFGQVLVVRGKMPSFPRTRNGDNYYAQGTNVKYFSITTSASPVSGAGYNTVYDEIIPVDDEGFYTIVVSWARYRPANATLANGYVWMDADKGEGWYVGARDWIGILTTRFQASDPDWEHSPSRVPAPTVASPTQQESVIMGDYFQTGTYMTKAEFEANY